MFKSDMRTVSQIAAAVAATLSGTTPAKGNIVDTADFGAVTFAFATGTVSDAGTAAGFTIKLQESDTTADTAFADVAGADLVGGAISVTDDAADNLAVGSIGYVGARRYVRAVVTGTTGTNAAINGVAVLQNPRYAPPDFVAANIAAS